VRLHIKSADFGSPGDDRGGFLPEQDEDSILHCKNKDTSRSYQPNIPHQYPENAPAG
jgi:hypothetical protein